MGATTTTQPDRQTGNRAIGRVGVHAVLAALAVGVLLSASAQTVFASTLPDLTGEIGTLAGLSWPISVYLAAAAAAMPVLGKLGTIYPPRPVYAVSMAIFLGGTALAGASQGLGQFVLARAIQGVGGGGLLVLGFTVAGDVIGPLGRVRYRNALAVLWGAGTLLGPALGGVITEHLGWRWSCFADLPIGALILLVVARKLRLPRRSGEGDLDLIGALLLALGLGLMLLYVTREGPLQGWTSSGALVVLAEVVAVATALLIWEKRISEPLLPRRMLENRVFLAATATAVLAGSAVFGVALIVPLQARIVLGAAPIWSGLLLAPVAAAAPIAAISAVPAAWHRLALGIGTGAVLVPILLLYQPQSTSRTWLLALIAGGGLGLVWRIAARVARSAVPPEDAGSALPSMLLAQIAGCALAAALVGSAPIVPLARYSASDLLDTPGLNASAIRLFPEPGRSALLSAFQQAGQDVVLAASVIAAVAFLVGLAVPPVALRSNAALAEREPQPTPETPTTPTPEDSAISASRRSDPEAPTAPTPPENPTTSAPGGFDPEAPSAPTPPEDPTIGVPHGSKPEPAAPTPPDDPTTSAPRGSRAVGTRREPVPPTQARRPVRRRSRSRRLATVVVGLFVLLAAGYAASLLYAGPGVLRGTTVDGVPIGGMQPAQAERKLDHDLRPAANAAIPVQAGDQRLTLDPREAGLNIDPHATVAAAGHRSFDPVQLANTLLHAPRRVDVRTTSDPARLSNALEQVDRQVHRDPHDGTITFSSGTPRAVPSQDGQSVDIRRAAAAVRGGYMRGRPVVLPMTVLHPKVSNEEVSRAMRDFAEPAVSGPVVVSAGGKTATLPPAVFAPHLSMTADGNGTLHPALDGAGVLQDGSQQLDPLQTRPQPASHGTQARDGQVIEPDDLAKSMLAVLAQPGNRVAFVPLTTAHP